MQRISRPDRLTYIPHERLPIRARSTAEPSRLSLDPPVGFLVASDGVDFRTSA